jgi:hypothetical protein
MTLPLNAAVMFLIIPIVAIGCAWLAAAAYRMIFPADTLPLDKDPVYRKRIAYEAGELVAVNAKEIHNHRKLQASTYESYDFEGKATGICPSEWHNDLWERRN